MKIKVTTEERSKSRMSKGKKVKGNRTSKICTPE